MKFIKKQGLGTWLSCVALLLALIGMIIYSLAVNAGNELTVASGSEYFYDFTRPEDSVMPGVVVPCGIISIVLLAVAIILGQFKLEGILGKVCDIVIGIIRIAVPVLLIITTLYFVYGSFTGLGWTFFSNEELAIYPEATAVGTQVITALIFFVISFIATAVAAFFGITKKEVE